MNCDLCESNNLMVKPYAFAMCSLGWGFGTSLARVLYEESGVCVALVMCSTCCQ